MAWDDDKRRGRRHDQDQYKGLVSGRIGPDGQRTFHCNFESVRVDGGTAAVDYLERAGDFESKSADLEHVAGDTDHVREAAQLVDQAAVKRRGRTAEKVLVKMTVELPAEMSSGQRAEVANSYVNDLKKAGYVACAAVHGNGIVQPHIHLATTARPVDLKNGQVNRDPHKVFLRGGKKKLRLGRAWAAVKINEVLGRDFFHPGKLKDTGIDRAPERRVPQRQYRVLGQREINFERAQEAAHMAHKAREMAKAVRERREARKAIRDDLRAVKSDAYRAIAADLDVQKKEAQDWRNLFNEAQEEALKEKQKATVLARRIQSLNEPASVRQIEVLQKMYQERGLKLDPEKGWTKGDAGEKIRQMIDVKPSGLDTPEDAPTSTVAPVRLNPDKWDPEAIKEIRSMSVAELQERHAVTAKALEASKAMIKERGRVGAVLRKKREMEMGLRAMEKEAARRGLLVTTKHKPTVTKTSPKIER